MNSNPLILSFSREEKGPFDCMAAMQIHVPCVGNDGISLVIRDFTDIPINVYGTAVKIHKIYYRRDAKDAEKFVPECRSSYCKQAVIRVIGCMGLL